MLVQISRKLVWAVAAIGLLLSVSSHADYLYDGGYYKKRSNGNGFKRHFHGHKGYRTTKTRRTIRRLPARPHSNRPHSGHYPESYNDPGHHKSRPDNFNNHGHNKTRPDNFNRNSLQHRRKPSHGHGRRACRSVDSVIWEAQRRYPGGKIIKARAVQGRNGHSRHIEVRVLYRGRVFVKRVSC